MFKFSADPKWHETGAIDPSLVPEIEKSIIDVEAQISRHVLHQTANDHTLHIAKKKFTSLIHNLQYSGLIKPDFEFQVVVVPTGYNSLRIDVYTAKEEV